MPSGGLRLQLATWARRAQALPSRWTEARLTLSNASLLSADRTEIVPVASFSVGASAAGTSATLFTATRPGAYTLYANTFEGSVLTAMGTASVLMRPGSPTSATIPLVPLRYWTAGVLANTSGTDGTTGEGVSPVTSAISGPKGIAIGSDGALYFAESGANRIRRIDTPLSPETALMSTVAGSTALISPQVLAYDATHDVLFVSQTGTTGIYAISSLSTAPSLDSTPIPTSGVPTAMAFYHDSRQDLDYLYVAAENHTVERIVDPRDTHLSRQSRRLVGTVNTPGYTPTAQAYGANVLLRDPQGLAIDDTGRYLYVSDTGNHLIRRVDLSDTNNFTTTLWAGSGANQAAGDGRSAASASFKAPAGLAYDPSDGGRLYILDTASFALRAITVANGLVTTVFGTNGTVGTAGGNAQEASLSYPAWFAFGNGGIFVSESGASGSRIRSATP